jgi:hypothetical protein
MPYLRVYDGTAQALGASRTSKLAIETTANTAVRAIFIIA